MRRAGAELVVAAADPPARAVPRRARRDWVRNPIDAFILARLETDGL